MDRMQILREYAATHQKECQRCVEIMPMVLKTSEALSRFEGVESLAKLANFTIPENIHITAAWRLSDMIDFSPKKYLARWFGWTRGELYGHLSIITLGGIPMVYKITRTNFMPLVEDFIFRSKKINIIEREPYLTGIKAINLMKSLGK